VSLTYLASLLVCLGAMVAIDWRFRLFFWRSGWRAAVVLATGVVFFLAWDLLGIGFGIFHRGETAFMTGVLLGPELPLEEAFFLAFLCYLTMNLVLGLQLMLAGRQQA
jgi:lycopene cyclase domain-containing protein